MTRISEFDLRQLGQMRFLIDRLRTNAVTLSQFVTDQWSLIELLETIDQQWKADYFDLVNSIEDLYANLIDQGRTDLNETEKETVAEILNDMLELLGKFEAEQYQ